MPEGTTSTGAPVSTNAAPVAPVAPASPVPASSGPDLKTQFLSLVQPAQPVPGVAQTAEPLAGKDVVDSSGASASSTAVAEPAVDPTTDPTLEDPLLEDADFENLDAPIDPKSTRGQKLWAEHQFYRTLTAAPDQGGIGHEPTVEDIRQYHSAHMVKQAIEGDLNAGSERFLEGFAHIQPQGLAEVLSQIPRFLTEGYGGTAEVREFFEPARKAIADSVVQSQVDNYLYEARQTSDPKARQEWFNKAQMIARDWLQKDLSPADLNIQTDPLAEERKRLANQQAKIDEHNSRIATETYTQFNNNSMSAALPKLDEVAANLLAPFKAAPAYSAAKAELMRQTIDLVDKSPQAGQEFRTIHSQVQRAIKANQATPAYLANAQSHLVNTILKYARPQMNQLRSVVAKDLGLFVRNGQVKKPEAIRASGSPVQASPVSAPPARDKGESFTDFGTRSLLSSLTSKFRN